MFKCQDHGIVCPWWGKSGGDRGDCFSVRQMAVQPWEGAGALRRSLRDSALP